MKLLRLLALAFVVLIVPCGAFAESERTTTSTVKTTETMGTVNVIKPDTIVIQSDPNSPPTNYSYSKSTTYVDENGDPVSMETVRSGQPVTVYYTREGNQMIANKVVVRKTTKTIEKPGYQETTTTTTTIEHK